MFRRIKVRINQVKCIIGCPWMLRLFPPPIVRFSFWGNGIGIMLMKGVILEKTKREGLLLPLGIRNIPALIRAGYA